MTDMAQADRTLYHTPCSAAETEQQLQRYRMRQQALAQAASEMGFEHFMHVPADRDEELMRKRDTILEQMQNNQGPQDAGPTPA